MTKPGNSGSEEPKQADAPEQAASPTAETHESPTGAPGGPPASRSLRSEQSDTASLSEGTDNSGAAADLDAEDLPDTEPEEAPKPAAKTRKAKPVDPEPLMAELEKAPPPPREQALRAQAKRRFEEPPPRMLRFSFYFFTAAGLVWLVSMVVSLFYKQTIIDNQIKTNQNPNVTPEQITNAINQLLWILIIASLAFTVFLTLFGYKATEGTRRARTLVTIFAAIMILFHLLLAPSQLGILSALLAVTGLALLWSPSSRKYFPPRQVL